MLKRKLRQWYRLVYEGAAADRESKRGILLHTPHHQHVQTNGTAQGLLAEADKDWMEEAQRQQADVGTQNNGAASDSSQHRDAKAASANAVRNRRQQQSHYELLPHAKLKMLHEHEEGPGPALSVTAAHENLTHPRSAVQHDHAGQGAARGKPPTHSRTQRPRILKRASMAMDAVQHPRGLAGRERSDSDSDTLPRWQATSSSHSTGRRLPEHEEAGPGQTRIERGGAWKDREGVLGFGWAGASSNGVGGASVLPVSPPMMHTDLLSTSSESDGLGPPSPRLPAARHGGPTEGPSRQHCGENLGSSSESALEDAPEGVTNAAHSASSAYSFGGRIRDPLWQSLTGFVEDAHET